MTGILIRQGDGSWLRPAIAGFAWESELQEILAAHPELIPGVSAAAVTCREFQSDIGPADVVVVDSTGELTLGKFLELLTMRYASRHIVNRPPCRAIGGRQQYAVEAGEMHFVSVSYLQHGHA